MPGATLHLTHIELLSQEEALIPELRQTLEQELTYARLGAVFPDLPFYTNIVTMMLGYWLEMPAENCPFAQQMHRYHPDLFAWHFLAAAGQEGKLLGSRRRQALLAGFLAHLALDLEVHPLVNWCARRDMMRYGGHESHHHRLTEKYQSLFFHRDLQGRDVLGRPTFFMKKTLIVDHAAFFRLNLEAPVVRWSTEMLSGFFHNAAPSMRQFASWVRSFRHFSLMVSLPAAQRNGQRLGTEENRRRYYDGDEIRFRDFWQRGYDRSVALINMAHVVLRRGDFSEQARERFLAAAAIEDLAYPSEHHLPPLPRVKGDLRLQATG